MNKETLKNSYARFEEEGILQVAKSKDSKHNPPRLRLSPSWQCPRDPETGNLSARGRLWDFTEKIARSRREGKNRRDGATVSTRVVALTDLLGRKLFEEARAAQKTAAEKAEGASGSAVGGTKLTREEKDRLRRKQEEGARRRTLENRAHL